jgi:endonuclease/exonuclease/phosphatase family metal-dependent hydrolase
VYRRRVSHVGFDRTTALAALEDRRAFHGIPPRAPDHVRLATWNLRQLGDKPTRQADDYACIAKIVSYFDVVAIQEVKASVAGIRRILEHLPETWRVVFSDVSGNSERLACLYDSSGVQIGDEIGEATFTPNELDELRRQDLTLPPAVEAQLRSFVGFNRSPHLTTFRSGTSEPFALANLHLYFSDMTRRLLEALAIGWWAAHRRHHENNYATRFFVVGDMNVPSNTSDGTSSDPILGALKSYGLTTPESKTKFGSDLEGAHSFDQVAFFPAAASEKLYSGVFDWDTALRPLFAATGLAEDPTTHAMRNQISDHRPLWVQLETRGAAEPVAAPTPQRLTRNERAAGVAAPAALDDLENARRQWAEHQFGALRPPDVQDGSA